MDSPRPQLALVQHFSASECARRTGLTIRALHLYERKGLIRPRRLANGWRTYGPEELQQLAVIVALKSLGLSLTQIQSCQSGHCPSMEKILRMQLAAWNERRQAADKIIPQLNSAIAKLADNRNLTAEELCDLLKSHENRDLRALAREMINEAITPEEERAWITRWSQLPPEAAGDMIAYGKAHEPLMQSLQVLHASHRETSDAVVQALIAQMEELIAQYRVRDRSVENMLWDPVITRKFQLLGLNLAEQGRISGAVIDFLWAAVRQSPRELAIAPIEEEVVALISTPGRVEPAAVDRVISRFVATCAEHGLGEPAMFASWMALCILDRVDGRWTEMHERRKAAWRFLATNLAAPPIQR